MLSRRPRFKTGSPSDRYSASAVLVTRPRDQAAELIGPLEQLGAQCYLQPAIEILPPETWDEVDSYLNELEWVTWLVFSSANGVEFLLNRMLERGQDLEPWAA